MLDPQIPCDVKLPPATVIKAGCHLSTLIEALVARGMDRPTPEHSTSLVEAIQNAIYALEYWDREASVRGGGKFEDERQRGRQEISRLRTALEALRASSGIVLMDREGV